MQDNPAAASYVTASFTLRTPPQFTFDNPAQWTVWLQQFEDYSFVSGLSSAPEETKVRTLLYCMGPQGREVLSSLMSDAEAYHSYFSVTTSLSGYFVHPVNEVYESSRFHKRTQAVGESVDAFFTALRNLVKKCNYASREIDDRLVRDRFIVGLRDSRLTDQLGRNPKLTLDEALIQARTYEDTENEKFWGQGTGLAPDALNVNAVANNRYRMADAPACEAAQSKSNVCRPPEYRAGPKSACGFCGHAPHPRSECPARWATCNQCRKKGHFMAICRSNNTRRLSQIQLCAVDASQTERRHVVVHVNGRPLQFKVDTGADVSVVPPSFAGCPVDLDKPDHEQLMGPGRCRLRLLGTFPATLSWRGRSVCKTLYVVADIDFPLLGYSAVVDLGVVQFVDTVEDAEAPNRPPTSDKAAASLFSGLGEMPEEYHIRIKPGAIPFSLSVPRRILIPLEGVVKKHLYAMERDGVIRRVTVPTPWCAGIVLWTRYFGRLGNAAVFSKLDAKSGFHQVRLSESRQELTTFITPFGRYCYRRLPFGITSAPEVFQRRMSRILEGLEGCVNVVDDILVFGRSRSEHDSRLQAVLRKLEQAGITLNASKCSFGVSSVKFLGVVVSASGISADPDKVSAIVNMKPPTDTHGVRRFLGMLNHIGRFLPNLSAVTTPIRLLLNKNAVWTWDHAQATSFETLKGMVASNACMASYNPELPTLVSADASSFGLGAVLLQEQQMGERRAVAFVSRALTTAEQRYSQIEAFVSRALTTAEQRYSQIEKEVLGVSWAIERFEEFLRGLSFVVETDHQPLVRLLGSADLDLMPPRIQIFRIRLMRYQFTVKYVPEKYLATAHTLSRDPEGSSTSEEDSAEIFVSLVVAALPSTLAVRLEDFRSQQTSDGLCSMLKAYCMKGWPRRDRLPLNITRYWDHRGDFTVCENMLFMGGRLVVPAALHRDIVNLLHDGPQGVNRCLAVARGSVWWPGFNSQVKAAVENCPACASIRVQRYAPLPATAFSSQSSTDVDFDKMIAPDLVPAQEADLRHILASFRNIFDFGNSPLDLQEYSFDVTYRSGRMHQDADCLSRHPVDPPDLSAHDSDACVFAISDFTDICGEQLSDANLRFMIRCLAFDTSDSFLCLFRLHDGILYQRNTNTEGPELLVVPATLLCSNNFRMRQLLDMSEQPACITAYGIDSSGPTFTALWADTLHLVSPASAASILYGHHLAHFILSAFQQTHSTASASISLDHFQRL
nr:uncharacterized protein LOC119168167 [Rhipicephalus microplus]